MAPQVSPVTTDPENPPPTSKDAAPKKKSDLIPRVMTAVVMLPIIFTLIYSPHWLWGGFLLAAVAVGLHEINAMLMKHESLGVRHVITGIGTLFYAGIYLFVGPDAPIRPFEGDSSFAFLGISALVLWSTFLFHLARDRDISRVAATMSASLAGIFYVGIGFLFAAIIRRDLPQGADWVIMLLGLCWMSDTGAYFSGRAFGKHKLSPKVSPNKTIEGALGGLTGSILAAFIFNYTLLGGTLSLLEVLLLALPANILAQSGDLCQSLLKRSCKVKDSGTIIRGHGGMLDRVDAVIFVAPYVYLFARFTTGS